MFQDLRLRAGPRARLLPSNTSAAMPLVFAAAALDTAGSGNVGTLCPAHWPANHGSLAIAATVRLPSDRRRCNNALEAASAETSTRSPSKCICDAAVDDAGLDCSHPRRDTVYGPREPLLPLGQVSERSCYLHSEALLLALSAGRSPAEPAFSLSRLPHGLSPNRPSRRHAPLAATPMGAGSPPWAPSPPSSHGGQGQWGR